MLLKISKILLHVSLFSVVIVLTSAFFPFIGGKDYFFRFAVELALIFFILWWAFEAEDGEARRRIQDVFSKPLFIAVSIFVLALLLATAFGYDARSAFWSNYERGEGGFQMIHYYIFFALLVLLMETKENWRMFFKTALVAASAMILYGIFADLGWAGNFISAWQGGARPDSSWGKLTANRFQGSLGNPAYVAPYLMFSIFYALYLWASCKSALKRIYGAGYGALATMLFFFFLLAQTKGAFLGLGAAVAAFLLYLIIWSKDHRVKAVVGLGAALVLGAGLFTFHNQPFIKSLPASRLFEISVSDSSAQTRFWTWGSAWQGFKERPILGWGPENFSTVFDKYFDPRHFKPGQNTETWFDRAHSIYFDYAAETGLLGLAAYLSIFAVFYFEFFKKRGGGAAGGKENSSVERALVFSLPLGYLVQGAVIFDVLPMYINLFAFFAFGYFYLYRKSANSK